MKLLVKLLIAVLVIGILLPFTLLKGNDGKPLISFTDLKLPDMSIISEDIQSSVDESLSGEDIIYKWTDTGGNLQFSNSPPPVGATYTVLDYDPNLNVIQAVAVRADEPEAALEIVPKKETISAEDIGSPYSVEKIEKLFEDANNTEKLLNQRLKNQEAIIGQ
jgi:hypothetical protein